MPNEYGLIRKVEGPTLRPGGFTLVERAVSLYPLPPGAFVLDVGCGTGATASFLRREHGLSTFGVDFSAEMLADVAAVDRRLPLVRGRAQQLPYRGGAFDGLICECALSLVPDKETALREFYRILHPGGVLVLNDIYIRAERESDASAEPPEASCLKHAVSRSAIESLLADAGFSILLWEDHSRLLNELAARIVFEGGSLDAFLPGLGHGKNCSEMKEAAIAVRPGYYLLIAGKIRTSG